MMKKSLYTILGMIVSILLTACGSNSKADGGGVRGQVGLSIAYESTEYDAKRGFIDHYRAHATDANGKAISGLALESSIVNGVRKIRNRKLQYVAGGIESSTPITFFDNGIDFSQTDVRVGDNLIVIPSDGKTNPSYLGDWTITKVGSKLTLAEGSFNLESTNGLTYIIGNEQRYLGGAGRGRVATAHIERPKGIVTDAKGFSYFDVVYDPVLGRHTVALGVHTKGDRKSAGKIAGLRGGKLGAGTFSFVSSGGQHLERMTVFVTFGGEGSEHFIDQLINPSTIKVSPAKNCRLNTSLSNFHTDGGGGISLVIDTNVDIEATEPVTCSINAEDLNVFFEY